MVEGGLKWVCMEQRYKDSRRDNGHWNKKLRESFNCCSNCQVIFIGQDHASVHSISEWCPVGPASPDVFGEGGVVTVRARPAEEAAVGGGLVEEGGGGLYAVEAGVGGSLVEVFFVLGWFRVPESI